eukprot:2881813-Prymnesium_polylepis.1
MGADPDSRSRRGRCPLLVRHARARCERHARGGHKDAASGQVAGHARRQRTLRVVLGTCEREFT